MISDQAVQAIMNDLDASTIEWKLGAETDWIRVKTDEGESHRRPLKNLKKLCLFCYFWVSL